MNNISSFKSGNYPTWLLIYVFVIYVIGWHIGFEITTVIVFAHIALEMLFMQNFTISKSFLLFLAPFLLIVSIGFIVGITQVMFNIAHPMDFLRDLFYYLGPVIYAIFGYILSRRYLCSLDKLFSFFFFLGVYLAIAHIIEMAFNIEFYLNSSGNINDRTKITHFINISILLMLAGFRFNSLNLKPSSVILILILMFSMYFSYSRVSIFVLLLFIVGLYGVNFFKIKRFSAAVILISISIAFLILDHSSLFLEKLYNSFSELSKTKFLDDKDINHYWRSYESIKAIESYFNDGGIFNHLFGYGFGKTSDLGISIKLGDNHFTEIGVFHNAYISFLLKTGVIGLFAYIFFSLYFVVQYFHVKVTNQDHIIKQLIAICLLTLLFINFVISAVIQPKVGFVYFIFIGSLFFQLSIVTIKRINK